MAESHFKDKWEMTMGNVLPLSQRLFNFKDYHRSFGKFLPNHFFLTFELLMWINPQFVNTQELLKQKCHWKPHIRFVTPSVNMMKHDSAWLLSSQYSGVSSYATILPALRYCQDWSNAQRI